ncbi:General transcription factor IIF subunit 2 [Cucumispora dikerogammari]|nr:General transcription factor IIF subunit 2 [Cucumispora dikerogammari]
MFLDTTNCNVAIWNVKFPKELAEIINKLQTDTDLGTLKIIQEQKDGPIIFDIKFNDNLNMKLDFKIELKTFKGNSLVVKDLETKPKVEGALVKECFVTPILNEKYFKHLKEKKSSRRERQAEWIDFENDFTEEFEDHRLLETDNKKRKEMLRERRKERLAPEEALNLVFSCFEQQEKWNIKELSEKTGQPVAFITEIMKEIGEKEDGPGFLYRLKDQFT